MGTVFNRCKEVWQLHIAGVPVKRTMIILGFITTSFVLLSLFVHDITWANLSGGMACEIAGFLFVVIVIALFNPSLKTEHKTLKGKTWNGLKYQKLRGLHSEIFQTRKHPYRISPRC